MLGLDAMVSIGLESKSGSGESAVRGVDNILFKFKGDFVRGSMLCGDPGLEALVGTGIWDTNVSGAF